MKKNKQMTATGLLIKKLKVINFKRMDDLAELIAKNNNKSKSFIKRDMFFNFLKYGIGYTDYFKNDFVNLTKEEKKTFITTKNYFNLIGYLNDRRYRIIFSDKIMFNQMFHKYIKRNFIDIRIVGSEGLAKFMEGKETVFAKAVDDFGGHNMSKVIVADEKDVQALYNRLYNDEQYLVEDTIIQHPELQRINPYAVNSFRIVTLLKDGKVHILNNALRINVDTAVSIGCSDAFAKLNEDGTQKTPFVDDTSKIHETHPLTGEDLSNVNIPFVHDAFEMVKEAALVVPKIRYIGWDVAFTNDGPIIVEGNEYPSYGLIQYYMLSENRKKGHLAQIAEILGDEMKQIKL